jgi:hypothetical protein
MTGNQDCRGLRSKLGTRWRNAVAYSVLMSKWRRLWVHKKVNETSLLATMGYGHRRAWLSVFAVGGAASRAGQVRIRLGGSVCGG